MRKAGYAALAAITIWGAASAEPLSARCTAGLEQLRAIDGPAGERVVEQLEGISPDLGRLLVEFAFGDVYARPGLDVKSKELAVVAALTAMGTATPQLKVHIAAALHVGVTPFEISEAILQMSIYAGFPAALNGTAALKDVICAEGICAAMNRVVPPVDRHMTGAAILTELDGGQLARLETTLGQVSPDLARMIVDFGFGEVLSRPGLLLKQRELITIAALTAKGTAPAQLRFHINAGLNAGLTDREIREVMILMTVYAGFPAAINGTVALRDVLTGRSKENAK